MDWITELCRSFARRLVQEAEMQEENWFVAHPEVMRYILQHERQPLTVLMEDEPVHTDSRPFCSDMTCGCHKDRTLIREHLMEPERAGLLTWFEARSLWRGVTL